MLKKVCLARFLSWVSSKPATQAESELSDKNQREELDAVMNHARITVLKSLNLPTSTTDTDYKLREIGGPSFKVRVRAQAKEMLIEEEVRRRKYVFCFTKKRLY